jgi:hypothetical protein
MKISWSNILIIAMGLFIILIVSMGIKMANSTAELYETDYYEQGEDYSNRQDLEAIGSFVDIEITRNQLLVNFDSSGSISQIEFRYLADQHKDTQITFNSSEVVAQQVIDISTYSPGIWVVEIEGLVNDKPFFKKYKFSK